MIPAATLFVPVLLIGHIIASTRMNDENQVLDIKLPNAAQPQYINPGYDFFVRNFCVPCTEVADKETTYAWLTKILRANTWKTVA